MKALLLSEYNHLEVKDLPCPTPGSDELLIQVSACGICGSDVHGYDGSTGRRIPPIAMARRASPPLSLPTSSASIGPGSEPAVCFGGVGRQDRRLPCA